MSIEKLGLSSKALQLATEQPHLWEYRLFAQVIVDEVKNIQNLFKRGHHTQDVITDSIVTIPVLLEWIGKKTDELQVIMNQLTALISSNYGNAFGLSGVSGNPENIAGYSRKIAMLYYHTIGWVQVVRNTPIASRYEEVRRELEALPVEIITSIEQFGPEFLRLLDGMVNTPASNKSQIAIPPIKFEIFTERCMDATKRLIEESDISTKKIIELIKEIGNLTDENDHFDNDYKMKHVILFDVSYWDNENEVLLPAHLELFGHCFEMTIHGRYEPMKSVSSPKLELKYQATQIEDSESFNVMLDNDTDKIFIMSQENLDLLKQHYQEINKDILGLHEYIRDMVNSIVSNLLNDKELVEMGENFIDGQPMSFYTDIGCFIFIEFIVENIAPLGNLLLLYPRELKEFYIRKNSEFMENNDLDEIKSYLSDGLGLFAKVIEERIPEIEIREVKMYATYIFIYNTAVKYLAQKWEKEYKQYFTDIRELNLEKAIERFCSIETINHQDMVIRGVFIYYLIAQKKFREGNRNYIDCSNIFNEKVDKILEEKKYKDFVNKLKTTSNKKKHTIDDVDLMNGQEFEKFIAELFGKMGFETKITKASGDQGIDVIASKNGNTIGIQAKCYSNTVGNSAIQEVVAGKNYYRLDKAMVITNNFFSDSARQLATANSIVLWDRNILREKIEKIYNVA